METKITLYNTLTNRKETFKPLCDGKVLIYACGITPSNDAHIGHAFQAVIFDVITKYLRFIGYDVTYVRNYTDVDDKIIAKANELGMDALEYAHEKIAKIDKELNTLGCAPANIEPRVSEHIDDIIKFIESLIEKDYAYVTDDGDVFYRISKFAAYGKLSNINLENNMTDYRKENLSTKDAKCDFALWKSAKEGEIFWESPWGKGRPGWHIECSAMSYKYLGEHFDIHGGGRDLCFPHHENEIAQSEALYGANLANYWIHNGLIKVNGQKMSKSLGNSIIVETLIKEYPKDVIRLTFLKNSYRSDVNITNEIFRESEAQIYRLYALLAKINSFGLSNSFDKTNITEDFIKEMNSDFNTPNVIANIFGYETEMNVLLKKNKNEEAAKIMYELKSICEVLGLLTENPYDVLEKITNKYLIINGITRNEIEALLKIRKGYRNDKNYEKSDEIRDELLRRGIKVNDVADNQEWLVNI